MPKGPRRCWPCIPIHAKWLSRRAFTTLPTPGQSTATKKPYASTLHLPKTRFPLWSEPDKREVPFRERTTTELYKWQLENNKGPLFVLHDGPPYANGNLHMGHALNKILKDIILRFQVLRGRKVNYIPGWDCHGLPIENKTLEQLKAKPHTIPAAELRSASKATAENAIALQMGEMQQFGLLTDWATEGTYRTMDHDYEIRQLRVFQTMVAKGLIYRQFRPVHWSPSSRSALAEAELKYEEQHASKAAFVTFLAQSSSIPSEILDIVGNNPLALLIWTTTPWTLPANMAIAVNRLLSYSILKLELFPDKLMVIATERLPQLDWAYKELGRVQGSSLVGIQYYSAIGTSAQRSPAFPVVSASHVTATSGTGLVHIAPAHGSEDYGIFKSLDIFKGKEISTLVDDDGLFTEGIRDVWGLEAADVLVGKEVLYGGNKAVLRLLEEHGSLVSASTFKHKYPYDWKTSKPVIVRATAQWFADLEQIKEQALKALQDVRFYPPSSRTRLESFIRERAEWCISRQRKWGVPILSLHNKVTGESILTSDSLSYIIDVLDRKGTAHWWEGPVEDFVSPSLAAQHPPDTLMKGTDTMDVWFDSGTSWSLIPSQGIRSKHDILSDVCLEGSDQHRGWFQSLLLTYIGASDGGAPPQAPYSAVITHGFTLDEKGNKMSKSLGNVISPITIINGGKNLKVDPAYGADVLRLWAASVEYGKDVSMSRTSLAQSAEALRKLRNSARFILGNVGDYHIRESLVSLKDKLSLLDRYVLDELSVLEMEALKAYSAFNFPRVVSSLTHFSNITLSSLYFDINKDCLYADALQSDARRAVIAVLWEILDVMIRVMAPIVPHLSEEIHDVRMDGSGLSVFTLGWETTCEIWRDNEAKNDLEQLASVRNVVLDLLEQGRRKKDIKSSLEADVVIVIPDSAVEAKLPSTLLQYQDILAQLFIVSDVSIVNDQAPIYGDGWIYTCLMPIPDANHSQSDASGGSENYLRICVRQPALGKCPRCWQYTRVSSVDLCMRCEHSIE